MDSKSPSSADITTLKTGQRTVQFGEPNLKTEEQIVQGTIQFGEPNLKTEEQTQSALVIDDDFIHYNMNHKHRGMALIFNHEKFLNPKLEKHTGSKSDCDALKSVLEELGFAVTIKHNATLETLRETIQRSASADHSNHDCLLVFVLTHEANGLLEAHDAPYEPKTLWSSFAAEKCPTLAGKPKLFFVEASRYYEEVVDEEAAPKIEEYAQGTPFLESDFLIVHSTMHGHKSMRTPSHDSWYVQALVEKLSELGKELDIMTILTLVNQKVALDYESDTHRKQMPEIESTLTRILFFRDK